MSKKDLKGKKEEIKEEKKQGEEPFIIRREVILKDDKSKKQSQTGSQGRDSRSDLGKVQKKSANQDYNIVYREKREKPLSVSELFGLQPKEKETKKETKKTPTTRTPKTEKTSTTKKPRTSRPAPRAKGFDDEVKKGRVEVYKKDGHRDKAKPEIDVSQFKDNEFEREKQGREREKQRERKQEERKPRVRRSPDEFEEVDDSKLADLTRTTNLSKMFESGQMLDFYDVSFKGRRRPTSTRKDKRQKKKEMEDASKLEKITIPEIISVKDFSQTIKKTSAEVLTKLMDFGIMTTINSSIDFDTAFLIAAEFGIKAEKKVEVSYEEKLFDDTEDKDEDLVSRPPVVVVMGHVDHGKTSLLDAIRESQQAEKESGGITQHIGAYQVHVNDRDITFLDTPGHEAFTMLRARGAQVTDLAILVVAANDGVMPQTIEAINHAKTAELPIVVAINKMDLPEANPDKIKQDLMAHDLVPEEWGGDTIFVPISAKNKTGIDELLEMLLLQADMMELKSNPKKQAKGSVIEARLDRSIGPVTTLLIRRGTLKCGDTILVGSLIGRVRQMLNDQGEQIQEASASMPVEIIGLNAVPKAGETFYKIKDEKTAKQLVERRRREIREKRLMHNNAVTLDRLQEVLATTNMKTLNLIVKADVQGSVEALKSSLENLTNEEIAVKVVHAGTGAISENDVNLAKVSNGVIIGFNVRPDSIASSEAELLGVEIKTFSVIYSALEEVENAMLGMLDKKYEEKILGTAEVRDLFKVSALGTIAGCSVQTGKITRNSNIRVIRDNIVLTDTKIASLKREKDDVREVAKGYECGILLDKFNDIEISDILEAYEMVEVKRTLPPRKSKEKAVEKTDGGK